MTDVDRTAGLAGAHVLISDALGRQVDLITNQVGNFYTDAPLANPFHVALEYGALRIEMPFAPPAGSCNACHSIPPVGGAPGRIYTPLGKPATSLLQVFPATGSPPAVSADGGDGD